MLPWSLLRRVLALSLWPPGAGGAAAVEEREVSVLPEAHADERGRPHR